MKSSILPHALYPFHVKRDRWNVNSVAVAILKSRYSEMISRVIRKTWKRDLYNRAALYTGSLYSPSESDLTFFAPGQSHQTPVVV